MPLTVKLEWKSEASFTETITVEDEDAEEMREAGIDLSDPEEIFLYWRDETGDLDSYDPDDWGTYVYVSGTIS